MPKDKYAYIYNKVKVALDDDKMYLRPDLSLISLSRVVGTNTVYLSQSINLLAGCSFKTLINRYRVRYVCHKAEEAQRDVEDVARECSFWSRSTFYDVFKTYTGMTPRQYMDSAEFAHGMVGQKKNEKDESKKYKV